MFDKFEERCKLGWKSCYKMLDYQRAAHRERLKRYLNSMPKKLLCQECGGSGRYVEDYIEYRDREIYGMCGWCEGLGFVPPHIRGVWLQYKRKERKEPTK